MAIYYYIGGTNISYMKSNIYLKVVLTVIAANLTLLTAKELNLLPTANAATASTKQGKPGTNYGFIPVNDDGTINVKVTNKDPIDVQLRGIDPSMSLNWRPIKVEKY
jgi:hypothetical protein